MRIAFVTSRFPYPVEKGDKLRAFHQIKHLSDRHEIHLVSLSHKPVAESDLQAMAPYCKSVRVFRIHPLLLPIQVVLGWLQGLPLQVSYFLDRTIKRKVQYHIIQIDPDHVVCQLIRAAPYVRALPFEKTLDYMDVFSEGMWQRARKHPLWKTFFRWEARRLSAFERTIYKDFDHHTIISAQDRQRLSLPSKEYITVVPNGVDAAFMHAENTQVPSNELVFVGNLGYGPNIEAVRYLAKEILPVLHARGRKIKLLAAGARPSAQVLSLGQPGHITVKGWLPDIRDAYRDGRIFVAPMLSGLGLQNKILEAMAMGLPCITTTMVNNAIGAQPGSEILIGDSVDEIMAHIETLLDDPVYYDKIAAAGRALIARQFRWEDQVLKLEDVLQSKNVYFQK